MNLYAHAASLLLTPKERTSGGAIEHGKTLIAIPVLDRHSAPPDKGRQICPTCIVLTSIFSITCKLQRESSMTDLPELAASAVCPTLLPLAEWDV